MVTPEPPGAIILQQLQNSWNQERWPASHCVLPQSSTKQITENLGIRCRLTRTSLCGRGQNQAGGRPLGLVAAWLACAGFSDDADEYASAVPLLCFIERTSRTSGPFGWSAERRTSPRWNGVCTRVTDWRQLHHLNLFCGSLLRVYLTMTYAVCTETRQFHLARSDRPNTAGP